MHPSPVQVLEALAYARAALWQAGDFELPQAVEPLQRYARELGVDPVKAERIILCAFAARSELP